MKCTAQTAPSYGKTILVLRPYCSTISLLPSRCGARWCDYFCWVQQYLHLTATPLGVSFHSSFWFHSSQLHSDRYSARESSSAPCIRVCFASFLRFRVLILTKMSSIGTGVSFSRSKIYRSIVNGTGLTKIRFHDPKLLYFLPPVRPLSRSVLTRWQSFSNWVRHEGGGKQQVRFV